MIQFDKILLSFPQSYNGTFNKHIYVTRPLKENYLQLDGIAPFLADPSQANSTTDTRTPP